MRIRKNLLYLSGGLYGQLGNVFGVKHAGGIFLVDAGNPGSYGTIIENLNYWGIPERAVTHVLLTHGHDDHAGTAGMFQALGTKIVMGKADAYMLRQGSFGEESPFLNHQMPCCEPDILIEGDTVMTIGGVEIRAYAMPGHTDGSLVYQVALEDDSVLFTGDMFSCDGEKGDQAKVWWKGDLNYSGPKLGESFKKLWNMKLSPTIVLGGHGNPRIGADAKTMIMTAYKDYLLNCR